MNAPAVVQVNSKEWIARTVATLPLRPPYSDKMAVTQISTFGMHKWEYPEADLPPGSRELRYMHFLGFIRVRKKKYRLESSDTTLLTQLKECMVAFIFRQSLLPHKRKLTVPKPRTVLKFFHFMRRLFVLMKINKLHSVSRLSKYKLDMILSELHATDSQHNQLIESFAIMLIFAESNLITCEIDATKFRLLRKPIIKDTSGPRGAQTLTDVELATAIESSRFYIDYFENLIEILDDCRTSKVSKTRTDEILSGILPTKSPLNKQNIISVTCSLILIAAYNFLGWHLGARISEILSAKRGFVTPNGDSALLAMEFVDLQLEARKSVAALHGNVRAFAVHPYLARVCHVLEKLNDFLGNESEYLFVQVGSRKILETNHFNHMLKRFASLHGFSADISSHSWRNTLVSVTVRSVAEPLGPLAQLLGHKHLSTVVGYAFSNPFVRKEMRRALSKIMSPKVDRFLDQSRHFGGIGLSGPQGVAIEKSIAFRVSRGGNISQIRKRTADELISRNMSLLPVDTGIDCIKPPLARGRCAHRNGDILSDTEQCHVDCPFRAESDLAREALRTDIHRTHDHMNDADTSMLMKVRWASDIIGRLQAWPDLIDELVGILNLNPSHWRFFEELQLGGR